MNRPHRSRIAIVFTALVSVASLVVVTSAQEDQWVEAMAAFADADRASSPPQHGVVFVGSSSIRFWDLEKSFPGRGYINRGFGGSEIADSIRHLELLVLKHMPRTVVMYAGDNDIARGKDAREVTRDFKNFATRIHAKLPDTRIAFIAIKPSTLRWAMVDEMRKANAMIRELVDNDDRLGFVDVDGPSLGYDGKPRPELLLDDGLHLTPDGYALWDMLLEPFLATNTATLAAPSSPKRFHNVGRVPGS